MEFRNIGRSIFDHSKFCTPPILTVWLTVKEFFVRRKFCTSYCNCNKFRSTWGRKLRFMLLKPGWRQFIIQLIIFFVRVNSVRFGHMMCSTIVRFFFPVICVIGTQCINAVFSLVIKVQFKCFNVFMSL